MAELKGLEPSASRVTGVRSDHLSYSSKLAPKRRVTVVLSRYNNGLADL